MTTAKAALVLLLTGGLSVSIAAQTARPEPHIGYLYPAGGQQGKVFQIIAGGQFLRGASGVHVSGEGVHAKVLHHYPPLRNLDKEQRQEAQRRFMQLRQKRLAEAAGRDPDFVPRRQRLRGESPSQPGDKSVELPDHPLFQNWESLSLREIEGLAKELFNARKRQLNAQIAELVQMEITIDRDAPPGDRELRVETLAGLTNPLRFEVGLLPEIREIELNDPSAPANLPKVPAIELPVLVNGQIKVGDIDRFRLKAQRGQNLVINVQARRLIPYLADAVPGWFQATVGLYDAAGKEAAFADDYRFSPDPVLFYRIPEDGEYELEIRDSLYRGRDDFVYRISIGEQPFITRIFPLGARQGKTAQASISGWNLPGDRLDLDTGVRDSRLREVTLPARGWLSNGVAYAVDAEPEAVESEPNNTVSKAQRVTLPIVLNGRIGRPGDTDYFEIKGRATEEIVAEVWGRRLNSPIDSLLRLVDSSGNVLEFNDDHDDREMGLLTHHADSYLRFRLPGTGNFYIQVTDSQNQGGDPYAYRLHIGPATPDFALRIAPSSLNVFAGSSVALAVHAVRKDGFDGEIEVVLKDAPSGFRLSGNRIPAGRESIRMTLTAPARPFHEPVRLQFEGRARISGEILARPAIPSEDMMQAFLYKHLVPTQELLVSVRGGNRRRAAPQLTVDGPVKLALGAVTEVRVKTGRMPQVENIELELQDAPAGVTLQEVKLRPDGVGLVIKSDAAAAKPGPDNLIVAVFLKRPEGQSTESKAPRQNRRLPLGVLPAIPFEIVAR